MADNHRIRMRALLGATIIAAAPVAAAPEEPLVWTESADIAPGSVPPPEVLARIEQNKRSAAAPISPEDRAAFEAGLEVGRAAQQAEVALAGAKASVCKALKEDVEATGAETPSWAEECKE